MMRLLKIAKSGLGGRAADHADERANEQEQVEASLDTAASVSAPHEASVGEAAVESASLDNPADADVRADAAAEEDAGEGDAGEGDAGEGDDEESSDAESDEFDNEVGAILAMIRSRKPGDMVRGDLPEETGATYQLLSELDRIWRSA